MERNKISLKNHPIIKEKSIQDIIANNPEIIGLGNLKLVGKETNQKNAGRIDLLFQEKDSNKIYEVEIQLGRLNESHLLRAVGYWNIERKNSPLYEHNAVVIAEDIEDRMLDLIELYKGNVSIIVLKMTAYEIENEVFLTFDKIDGKKSNVTDDGSNKSGEYKPFKGYDRQYWVNKVDGKTLIEVDKILGLLREIDSNIIINYTEKYIGFKKKYDDFVLIRPKCPSISKSVLDKSNDPDIKIKVVKESDSFVFIELEKDTLTLKLVLEELRKTETMIDNAGLTRGKYSKKRGNYPIKLTKADLRDKAKDLKKLLQMTCEYNLNLTV